MSENEKPRKDDGVDRDVVFYYSREHRLSRASATVRAINDEKSDRASFGKRLFGARGNIFIFMSILIICAMFGISSRLSSNRSGVKLGANTLDLSVFREEEALGLRILKTAPKSGEFYIGAVDIAVSPVMPKSRAGETPQAFGHRFFFNPTDTESFYISLPFDGDSFFVFLSTDDEQKVVRVNAR